MTWVLLSLRKQQLRARVNELTAKQLEISQEVMDLQRMHTAREDGIITANEMTNTPSKYFGSQMAFIEQSSAAAYESATVKTDAYINQIQQTAQATGNQYQQAANMTNSIQPAYIFNEIYKQELKEYQKQQEEEINALEKELEQEKLSLETQLKAAEAEYQSVSQQLDKSIESSAIQLA